MNLQGRNLSFQAPPLQGADVVLLQGELRLLGFTIPDEEVARATFGPSTRQAVLDFQTTHRLPANGVVDEATATQINAAVELLPAPPRSFVVRGEVRQADGRPAERHLVRVFDRDLRSAQELGTGHTGADGRFNIRYKDSDFARTEKATADLTFQLESQEGQSIETFQLYRRHNGQQILVESPQILFNASAFEAVEIVIGAGMYQGDSEYEGYIAQLTPLLQGLAIAELVENERYQDITFLTGETGIDPQHIAFLITAHLLERTTRLEAAIFYGFLRKQLPSALPALLCYNPAAQRRALEAALREKIIPARLEAELDEILARLQALEAKQPAFLIQPQVLFSSLADLSTLSREQSGFVTEKLNEYLRSAIFAALGPVSQTMRRAIYLAIARLDYQKDKETNLATFIQERILAQVKRNQNLAQEAAKLAARLADATPTRVADVLHLDSALQVNPLFATELRHAKTFEYARLAQLDDRLARKLVEQNLRLDEADETTLTNLVTDGQLTEQQKKKLYQTLELGRLSGDNLPLIAALQTRGAHAAADLIGWEQADWQQFLTDERLPLPFGETAETYGSTLRLSLEQTYPSQALLHRLARREAARPISLLDSLQPLLIHNNRLIDGHAPAHVDWSGVSDQERARLEADLNDLASWANTCRRLGVVELVNDPALNLEQKKNAISTRLKLLDSFYQNNPEVDLRLVNFFAQSDNTLNWQGVPDAERPLVRQQLMAYQRVLSLADDTADRQLLLSKGYDAAFMMIGRSEAEFVKTSGLPPGKAKMSYYKAMQSAVSASHYLATIQDEVKGPFRHVAAANLPPHLLNDLQEIDGFDDLFGAQDFCDCEECRSMFSPAAYFVDLMYFIEQNISHPVFMYPYPPSINPMDTDHPLYLKNRRPDLWTLPLTCENTLTLIPYLTIVNEVLETYLNKVVNDDIYAKLSDVDEPQISFGLPFTLPLEEMRLYLSHFGLTLSDIFRTLQQDEDRIWRARLSLSVDEFTAITVSEPTIVRLRFGNPPSLDDFPVEDETGQPGAERRGFIKFAGITRQQLDELRQLRFNQDLAKILVTKKITPDELIYFPEILQNLTDARLDFIHRFLRLWRKVGWSIPDLDLVLYTLHEAGLIGLDLEGKAVLVVAQLVDLQEKLKLTVEELCALAGQLPVSTAFPFPPATQADRGLYERLFDLKKLFGENPATHKINPTAIYHHYSLNSNNPNDHEIDPKTPILLGGLGVSETELLLLFDLLKEEMPFDKNGDTKDPQGESTFDRGRVSLLYRHARLAKALRLNVEDFIQALHLNFANDDLVVTTLTQIHQLRQFRDWLRTSPFSVSELRLILTDEESTTVTYKMTSETVGAMVQEVQKALADNTVIKEPEIISARIVQEIQQSAALDKVEELKEQLEKLFNLAAGQAQAGLKLVNIDINGAAIQTALNASFTDGAPDNPALLTPLSDLMVKMERIVVLFGNLAKSFNLALSQVTDILEWVNNDSTGVQTVLSTTFPDDAPVNPADVDALLQFVHEIERVLLLFSSLKFKEETVAYLTQNPAVFGIVDLKQRELDDLKGLKFYKELISLGEEAELAVQAVLESYLATSDFSTDDIGRLAGLWKKDASLIESITNNNSIVLPTVPIAALAALFERLTLCHTLGVNAYSLQKLANDVDYTDLVVARDVVLGAFSSKYDDEKVRAEKLEPYQDKINVIKRDALCDYIIAREPELKFKDLPDLYAFFLLDVEMSGCFRTSRVVCANSSLQLYVHRVLMNLERSVSTELVVLSAMLHAVGEEYLEEQKKEWEWRKNYRVWEANRKVFLYPENYLEPDLRDNKTPPFKDLEDELLQKKITLEAAEAAYKKYIAQFAELARLTIAGSYYHDDTDTYYFFGRTQQDPPQYYYRQWVERKFWTPWEKIELAISAPHVSAILFLGKLFLFWVEVNIQEKTKVVNGSSVFDMYEYDVTLNYSYLNENNRWISAQKLEGLYEVPPPPVIVPKENEQIAKQIGEKQKELDQPGGHNDLNDWLVFWQQHLKIVNSANDQDAIDAAEEKVDHYQKEIEKKKNEIATLKNNQEKQMEEQVTNVAKDFKKEYLDSRSFRMCYPSTRTLNGKSFIAIESLWKPPDVEAQAAEPSMNSQWKKVDLFKNALTNSSSVKVSSGDAIRVIAPNGETSLLIWQPHDATTEGYLDYQAVRPEIVEPYQSLSAPFSMKGLAPDLRIVAGLPSDSVLTLGDQNFLFTKGWGWGSGWRYLIRLSTSLADDLGQVLFNEGLEALLALETQSIHEEALSGFSLINNNPAKLVFAWESPLHPNFDGAYGEYYWEIFFHIPFLIANHLNANQKFKEAKWWYERIFDPTSSELPDSANPTERNWRYVEFREVTLPKMKEILTHDAAIEQYKRDPFNPHAIARLRLSAYQKAIVMKYIDNLLDWGDYLFAQDTMESINEATMLYVMAADILGKRPIKQGKCVTAEDALLTYEQIRPAFDDEENSEFLLMLENLSQTDAVHAQASKYGGMQDLIAAPAPPHVFWAPGGDAVGNNLIKPIYEVNHYITVVEKQKAYFEIVEAYAGEKPAERPPGPDIAKQSVLVFCVPPNDELLKYWDRVADRLFKIRHCMNISGVRRSLALFAPPIDPMVLVRARAAGLSLEDILGMLAAPLPPYRFSYLIEKAKQYTQTVQSFGSTLLSVLEKKDVEELTLLRSVHERHILRMTKEIKVQQAREAQYQLQALVETKTNVQNRINYYTDLIDAGLTGWEITQQISKHAGTALLIAETALRLTAGISYLVPQVGSPFAMKYGGKETGDSQLAFSELLANLSRIADAISASAGLEATFQRREQEWNQQLLLAQQELKQVEQQRLAAEVRTLIADRDLAIHEQNMEHANELDEFYKGKFTSLGLYNYLSTTLNRLYREAYNMAYDLATMAERTYHFERDDDKTVFIAADNWQFDRAGLLAGERLLLQLQRLEKAYLEQNQRDYEVTQSFSLALFAPSALLELRQTGHCGFKIPEIMFDLFYPGQYKRLIKSVRITIPCVTGPYINVSAKLTLLNSWVRKSDNLNTDSLDENADQLGIAQNTSISASSAQNDAGMFELNFRDERYLPFEGAGAISTWKLELPSNFRPFNYDTISDVIIHISYTAKEDGAFRIDVENNIATTLSGFANVSGLFRLLSLKHEFPTAFYRLLHPPGQTQTAEFELSKQHFPYFLADKTLALSSVTVYLKPKGQNPVTTEGLTLQINNLPTVGWSLFPVSPFPVNLLEGTVSLTDDPIRTWTIDAGVNGLDQAELDDILILLQYNMPSP